MRLKYEPSPGSMLWANTVMTSRLPCPLLLLNERSCPTMRRLCPSSTGQTRSSASLATMTGTSFWPDRRSTRRGNLSNRRVWFSCEKTGSPAATPHSST
ncbi:MAG: hypothetical protein ACLTG0_09890 [Oscillibacter sp.]